MNYLHLRLLIGLVVAMILSILPMPQLIADFRPPWILLFILYIEYFLPMYLNSAILLVVGLLLDVLLATLIGEHSFALLLVTWLATSKSRRFQFFSMMQQLFLIGFFSLVYQIIIVIIAIVLQAHYNFWMPLESALVSMLVWPWIRLLGEDTLLVRLVYR